MNRLKNLERLLIVAVLAALFAVACQAVEDTPEESELREAEIATVGFDNLSGAPVVMLRDLQNSRLVPIWIGFNEAQSIMLGMQGVETPRPITHELALNLLQATDWKVEQVAVHDLRDGVYLGEITLRKLSDPSGPTVAVDSRPSDALALAVRSGATIRVAEKVFSATEDFQFVPPEEEQQVIRFRGATVVLIDAGLREAHGLPEDLEGLVVSHITEDETTELKEGDVIQTVDEMRVRTPMEFLEAVSSPVMGHTVRLGIIRNGEEKEVTVQSLVGDPDPDRMA